MSAISPNAYYLLDGIHAYRTKVKVVIHSHATKSALVLKQEVKSFSFSKAIKGPGSLSVVCVPNTNYLNRIFPNDYINLYVDRGDEQGWTRVFFGFVDRMQEDYSVDQSGTPNTSYTISCSDFSKAFEKSMIYFNPQIPKDRNDFNSAWIGSPNLGGMAMYTKGVAATGTPADVIINNIFVLFAASAQFVLPAGYTPRTKDKFRQRRAEFALGRLQKDVLRSLPDGVNIVDFLGQVEKAYGAKVSSNDATKLSLKGLSAKDEQAALEAVAAVAKTLTSTGKDLAVQTKAILASAESGVRPTLLDALDVFTFVEREAIDGYSDSVTIWQQEGSVMSLLMQQSNEVVNELFFDLRPTLDKEGLTSGSNWSRAEDETGHNIDDNGLPPGIRYVPSMVMREYPFSTIDSIDASSVSIGLKGADSDALSVGDLQFGAIFSDKPNVKGRHVIDVRNINVEDIALGKANRAKKHLDVAVIQPSEIISSSYGRSDHEHYNLTQFISDGILGEDSRYYMHEIVPIVNPVGIMRHGLRVRELTSSFARFAESTIPLVGGSAPASDDDTEAEDGPSAPVVSPIDPSQYTASSKYGIWRARPPQAPVYWIFHHGLDLQAAKGVPVMAVADGEVVACAPAGTPQFSGYGNCVVIKHKDKYNNETVFSLYAHLDFIDPGILSNCNPQNLRVVANAAAKSLIRAGRMTPFKITAGTQIGGVGKTDFADSSGRPTYYANSGEHLHFEILRAYPSKKTPIGVPAKQPWSINRPGSPDPSSLNSLDPVAFFTANGVNILEVADFDPDGDAKTDEDTDTAVPDKDTLESDDVVVAEAPRHSNVDNHLIRSQIARWALLDDHWYQHNIEYLSGTIVMRGAPEIRVGYRLDIQDTARPMSFYVEGVSHSWEFPSQMTTTLTVTRGQCNNPFPVYVLPYFKGVKETDVQRKVGSRLGKFFTIPSPKSARNGLMITRDGMYTTDDKSTDSNGFQDIKNPDAQLISDAAILGNSSSGELFVAAGDSIDLKNLVGKKTGVVPVDVNSSTKSIVDSAKAELARLSPENYNLADKVSGSNIKK